MRNVQMPNIAPMALAFVAIHVRLFINFRHWVWVQLVDVDF
jgi:hypothetical protein